jgi:hypothetical protein
MTNAHSIYELWEAVGKPDNFYLVDATGEPALWFIGRRPWAPEGFKRRRLLLNVSNPFADIGMLSAELNRNVQLPVAFLQLPATPDMTDLAGDLRMQLAGPDRLKLFVHDLVGITHEGNSISVDSRDVPNLGNSTTLNIDCFDPIVMRNINLPATVVVDISRATPSTRFFRLSLQSHHATAGHLLPEPVFYRLDGHGLESTIGLRIDVQPHAGADRWDVSVDGSQAALRPSGPAGRSPEGCLPVLRSF